MWQKMIWIDSITDSENNWSKLQEILEYRGAWSVSLHGVAKSQNNNMYYHTESKQHLYSFLYKHCTMYSFSIFLTVLNMTSKLHINSSAKYEHHCIPFLYISSVQCSHSVVSASLWWHGLQHIRPPYTISTPRDYSTHVHWVGDAIQLFHPLSSPFPPALNLSQHHGLFKWISSLHQVAKVLEFQLQHHSVQWIFRTDFL